MMEMDTSVPRYMYNLKSRSDVFGKCFIMYVGMCWWIFCAKLDC